MFEGIGEDHLVMVRFMFNSIGELYQEDIKMSFAVEHRPLLKGVSDRLHISLLNQVMNKG
jgi:hypothetical protein